jgi:DNA polymerase-4
MSKKQLHRMPPPTNLEGGDEGCGILHVDMDAFFVSVELRERPELRGSPVIVGGVGARGVVSSASYEARDRGVHSAMPMSRARRLCPEAVVLPVDHGKYAVVSAEVMEIFRTVTPLVEPLSLDEAFLDVSGARRRMGSPASIGQTIRAEVAGRLGITCSVGVAGTKFVAKLASTRCKPDGLFVVPVGETVPFLHALPIGALWGVGESTEQRLRALGPRTVGDLARMSRDVLCRRLGGALGAHLHDLSWGRDPRRVVTDTPDRSISGEETFPRDVADPEVVRRELLRLSERVAARLRHAEVAGRTVAIKLRRADFSTITRARTLGEPTDMARDIYHTVTSLYEASGLVGTPLRLVGVRVANLVERAGTVHQMALGEGDSAWREAERAVDRLTTRFGAGAIGPASLIRRPASSEHDEVAE